MSKEAILALEDGRIFRGRAWGAIGERTGEVVFNTSMMGYQEILTDPSYAGQIVTMTYPLIGNYGVNPEDIESRRPFIEGFVVREWSEVTSNWRATMSLDEYLKHYGIVGISDIDTRALVRHIREKGAMRACISSVDLDEQSLIAKAKAAPEMLGRNLVDEVTCGDSYEWSEKIDQMGGANLPQAEEVDEAAVQFTPNEALEMSGDINTQPLHVVAFDFGVKYYILRYLAALGCKVTVVPARTSAADVLALDPDGIFLSNGPGDPAALQPIVAEVQKLFGSRPMFGICLGHQMMALSLGAKTYKLKFGHRGVNHPIKDTLLNRIYVSSQNHGYAIDEKTLPSDVKITHVNLNDNTVAGFYSEKQNCLGIQYHPESHPGPHEAVELFNYFVTEMNKNNLKTKNINESKVQTC